MTSDILIIDDEADIRDLLSGLLEDEGYLTRKGANSDQAFEEIETCCPGLLILDIWLKGSGLDGLEILSLLRRSHPDLPIVMISGHGTVETAVEAIKNGAYDFIEKPFKSDPLLMTVARAFEAGRMRRELADLRTRLRQDSEAKWICHSPAMQAISEAIDRVAPTDRRVMITGAAGAGKTVVAQRIHALSQRAEKPFVILNCAILQPDRLEREIFGSHTRDAPSSPGLLEQANEGTIFLDEIADIPYESQGRMIQILQESSFSRLENSQRIETDIRILSSSSKDLQSEMKAGRFREDLFFHLCVLPINIPSLHERGEDIAEMAAEFMKEAMARSGINGEPRPLSEEALAAMQSYLWPGNVRQLRNVIDWVSIMAPGSPEEPIEFHMLPSEITAHIRKDFTPQEAYAHLGLRQAREAFERQYLTVQMRRFKGNITKTAAFVGMERSALHRKLKSLGFWSQRRTPVETSKSGAKTLPKMATMSDHRI